MNIELAKTLTIALVNYIDGNRPEGTMDCSSGECVSLEKALVEENFDSVETLINKKLSRLTEFEDKLVSFALQCGGQWDTANEEAKKWSCELLALVKGECKNQIESDYREIIYGAYEKGRADALKDLPRWRIWGNGACGNSDNIPIAIVKRGFNYELVSTLGIQGEHYIMLSDLEKLPGFKEG